MKKIITISFLMMLSLLQSSSFSFAQGVPELMYFKFDNVVGGVVPNDANPATRVSVSGTIVGGHTVGGTGQFGTGLVGSLGPSSTDYFNTGWTTNLTGSWTISLWLNVPNPPTTRYYFGDNTAASFRCFTGGAASTGLRMTGPITCNTTTIQPAPKVVHYVYDAVAGVMTSYINGVADVTTNMAGLSIIGTTGPFKIGGYASGNSYDGTIDEFRMYNRALSAAEVALTWNQPLPMGPTCNAPTGLTATGVTYNTANTSWGTVTGATGYQYAVTTSATPPASGTGTTATSYNATGLNAGTTYYLHVRSQCASTTFSSWATYSFTTLTCGAPTGLTSSNVTSNSATFSWTAMSGVTGYQYALTSNTTPPTSGTSTAATTYNAIGLTDNTNYCLHVRTECATGVFSSWVNTCITTPVAPPCPMPDTLNVTNITSSSADLSWNSLTTAVNYEYAVTTSAVPPASGIGTSATTYNATGLTSATQYYAHVRAACNGGIYSAWNTKRFNTPFPPCDPPVASVSNITNEAADISWNVMPEAISYQVAVFSNANPPTISGIPTTGTTYHANNLVSGKLYYVHVRSICSFDTSSWATSTFYTAVPQSITSVGGKSTIQVHPNPINDVLHIKLPAPPREGAYLSVSDITGRVVKTWIATAVDMNVDMSELPKGVFLLKYVDEQELEMVRIVKQ